VRHLLPVLLALCATAGLHAQEPSFRVTSDLVTVDALVLRGREPVPNLTAEDFELLDNGVPQAIAAITVPGGTHVIVVLDTSASVEGDILDNLSRALRALLGALTPEDRLSVVTFGDRVRLLTRAAAPGTQLDGILSGLSAEGGTALHDALVVGAALTGADPRPAVMVAFTDGADTASLTTATQILEMLRATSLVVFTVGAGLAELPLTAAKTGVRPYLESRTWIAAEATDAPLILHRIAQATGGSFMRVGRPEALARTFTDIVERYRQRYILSYVPTGVARDDGWHRLEVRLKGQRGSVQTRDGYYAGR
jgi:VWFA-related protein